MGDPAVSVAAKSRSCADCDCDEKAGKNFLKQVKSIILKIRSEENHSAHSPKGMMIPYMLLSTFSFKGKTRICLNIELSAAFSQTSAETR